ncbi:MAG: LapA family protein [Deltaproteobacteria bacterium]|nr:MAG: LapA family protein [Deltaproteobacteria bacterium]
MDENLAAFIVGVISGGIAGAFLMFRALENATRKEIKRLNAKLDEDGNEIDE